MAASVVYSGIFGAVMASIPAVRTKLVVFDTSIVDLTDQLDDPVEMLFSTQLGGGTDINRTVGYCPSLVRNPTDTIFVLISDLFEGGVKKELLRRSASLLAAGMQLIVLLALSDEGAPPSIKALPPSSPAWAFPPLPARPTSSPTSWPRPSTARISTSGRQRTRSFHRGTDPGNPNLDP